jgi:hypothetical protein
MERVCLNGACGMFGRAIESEAKRCRICGQKMKTMAKAGGDDRPQLLLTTGQPSKVDVPVEKLGRDEVGGLTFESNCDVEDCPVAPKGQVLMPWQLYQTCTFLCKKLSVEWLAYITGEEKEGNVLLRVDGMYFPKQKAQPAHVEADGPVEWRDGTIASIHSHVGMHAFFSAEDRDHFNHLCDMVINNRGEMEAVVRRKLDCGRFQRVKTPIVLSDATEPLAILEQLKSVLTVEKATVKAGEQWFQRRDGDGRFTSKGQHGLRTYSEREANQYLNSRYQDAVYEDDDNRYNEWQEQQSGRHTFRRSDNGRWEDLRD